MYSGHVEKQPTKALQFEVFNALSKMSGIKFPAMKFRLIPLIKVGEFKMKSEVLNRSRQTT